MRKLAIGFVLALLSLVAGAYAQTVTGAIVGSVQDPGGLAVPAAGIQLLQPATGVEWRGRSDERGDFTFRNLQPGEYTLVITAPGFKRFERRALALSAAETLAVGVETLEVGATTETITVTAQGATVQTASSERGGVITASQVEAIPVRGRNAWDLLQLLPGVVAATATNESIVRNTRFNINGGRINTLSTVLDGMGLNQIGNFANGLLNVSMDAVDEVRVLMSNYQAEYGRTSGGEVQLITKSGTRDFHGMVSYFKRHEQFNANNFFNNLNGLPKGRYRFNTWSYNIGGPVYIPKVFNRDRNKLFFFWSQEYWPVKTTGTGRLTVPSEMERAGDFSQTVDVNNARIAITDPTARTPPARQPGARQPHRPQRRRPAQGISPAQLFQPPDLRRQLQLRLQRRNLLPAAFRDPAPGLRHQLPPPAFRHLLHVPGPPERLAGGHHQRQLAAVPAHLLDQSQAAGGAL